MNKKKIVFVIASLKGGGAERVITEIANYWNKNKKNIYVITFDKSTTGDYLLEEGITLINQNTVYSKYGLFNYFININRIFWLRRKIIDTETSIVISFITSTNIITILATIFLPIRIIISERTDPSKNNEIGFFVKVLRLIFYRFANAIIVQNNFIKNWFNNRFFHKVYVIPNPIRDLIPIENSKENIIVSFGRLSEEKGFEILIRAFSLICTKLPSWKVYIFGDGQQKNILLDLIKTNNLDNFIFIKNRTENIEFWLSKAKVVVQPSLYEGMPNIILEAMSLGSVVIASSTGAEHVIKHKENGLIFPVKDFRKLSQIIYELTSNDAFQLYLSKNAIKISSIYSRKRIMLLWDNLLNKL